MSYYSEFYHDFANCFVDPDGRDIQDGRLTWLIVVACQRANAKQKAILHECYGAGDTGPDAEAKALAVKKVYKEFNWVKKRFLQFPRISLNICALINFIYCQIPPQSEAMIW